LVGLLPILSLHADAPCLRPWPRLLFFAAHARAAFTPSELDEAIIALSKLLPKLIRLAELEKTCDVLADEIEKTRMRVNAIEHIMIPDMEEKIKYIIQKLDDNERSNIIRLMKSKEIILNKERNQGY